MELEIRKLSCMRASLRGLASLIRRIRFSFTQHKRSLSALIRASVSLHSARLVKSAASVGPITLMTALTKKTQGLLANRRNPPTQILPGIPRGSMTASSRIWSTHGKGRCSSVLQLIRIPFSTVLKTLPTRQSFRLPRDGSSCCHLFGAAMASCPTTCPFFQAREDRSIIACLLRALSSLRCLATAQPLAGASLHFGVVSNRSRWTTPLVFLVRSFLLGRLGREPLRIPRTPHFSLVRSWRPTRSGKKRELAWV